MEITLKGNEEVRVTAQHGVVFINEARDGSIRIVFDSNEYKADSLNGLVILFPVVKQEYDYVCTVCGQEFNYDPDHEPHFYDGGDCHDTCCPICKIGVTL